MWVFKKYVGSSRQMSVNFLTVQMEDNIYRDDTGHLEIAADNI